MKNLGSVFARHGLLVVAVSIGSILPVSVRAANTWDGGGGDNNWSSANNWDDDQVPSFPAPLTFTGTTRLTPNNDLSNLSLSGISFTSGAGVFTLGGNAVTLAGNVSNSSGQTQTVGMPISLSGGTSIAGGSGININQPISGTGNLTLASGSLRLGANNSYSGDTVLDGASAVASLAYLADQTNVHTLMFGSTPNEHTFLLSVDASAASVTASGLNVQNQRSDNDILLGAGKPMTINGSVDIGNFDIVGSTITTGIQIHGAAGSSLVVNAGTGNLTIAGKSSSSGFSTAYTTFATAFTFTGNEVRIGGSQVANSGNRSSGSLGFGSGATSITANAITVGGGTNTLGTTGNGTLSLGGSTNVINADSIYVGTQLSSGFFNFSTSSGTLSIRNKAGTGRAAIMVGSRNGAPAQIGAPSGSLSLSGHSVDILASTLSIGLGGDGTVSFSNGTVDVTSIQMASAVGFGTLGYGGTGTLNLQGGNLIVNSPTGPGGGTFVLASTSVMSPTTMGNFNITGGTASVYTDISTSAPPPSSPTPGAQITLNGGTLDMINHRIGNGTSLITLNALKGTLKNVAQINAGGSWSKTGASSDVLVLDGTNSFTGAMTVSGGKLLLNGTHTGGGLYTVGSGATLGGTGSTTSPVTVNSGGFLSPGASIESLDVGPTTLKGMLQIEMNDADPGVVDLLHVTGILDISSLTSALDFNITGTASHSAYVFATYSSLTGTQFASVTDLPSGYTINYHYNDGNGVNNIALVQVPEPTSMVLLAVGGCLLTALARRSHANRGKAVHKIAD